MQKSDARRRVGWHRRGLCLALASVTAGAVAVATPADVLAEPAPDQGATTAWQQGRFVVDDGGVVRRSNVVLERANLAATQSMPLGNGTLGVAEWAADGLTAQLNRADTFPDRKSPGQLVIPGLAALTKAEDFHAHLDLYDGTLVESGGGMTASMYVRADKDELVVDVTGADPSATQTAQVRLWSGRSPQASAAGSLATLAETWTDNRDGGSSGQGFGSLAALTAGGRDVSASVANQRTIQVSFRPKADGSFRVVVGAPHWAGGDALATARTLLAVDPATGTSDEATKASVALRTQHLAWWHDYWNRVGLVKMSSVDGTAEYLENLRTVYLYATAAESRSALPGSQAGAANLFSFSQDQQDWFPAGYWFWNLRMQVAANLSSGAFALDDPVFTLYRENVGNLQQWTKDHMGGRPGICVPETMRFNGNGYYSGSLDNASCEGNIAPSWNARTITSGAEVALWIWQRYLMTDDKAFLAANYPVMREAARFLLSYATVGSDGLLHTFANAHETQWDVNDPVTDIVAMKALFPVVAQAAGVLGTDQDLAGQLTAAATRIPDYPRTDTKTRTKLLTAADDAGGQTMIAPSYEPAAPYHNSENLGLEPVWPYNLIGDDSPLADVAKRTYTARRTVNSPDWSNDPIQAARLGLADQMRSSLLAVTSHYQAYPSGLASLSGGTGDQAYIEQAGVVTTALNEALAQDYDGTLRIAPAWPSDWSADGTVYLQHKTSVNVQVRGGIPTTVAINAGDTHKMTIRNPWPGEAVQIVRGEGDAHPVVVGPTNANLITLDAQAAHTYLVERVDAPSTALPFAPVTGAAATTYKRLGNETIGLASGPQPPPCPVPTQPVLLAWDPTGGATITDASPSHRDGSFVNQSPAYTTDSPTGSAAVLANGGYLSAGTTTMGFLPAATFAIELNVAPGSGYRRIWDWKSPSGGDGDGLLLDLTPTNQLRLITSGTSHTFSTTLPTGTWLNLVVTIDSAGTVTVYLNGNRADATTISEPDPPGVNGCTAGGLHVGADQGGGQVIAGQVDRAAVFSKALTATEVADWQTAAGL